MFAQGKIAVFTTCRRHCSACRHCRNEVMLQKLPTFAGIPGPVVVIVMDGYGLPKTDVGSAIAAARKPTLDRLFANYPNLRLRAHGTAVGMPSDDDMGNFEVGHNAIGAGQV